MKQTLGILLLLVALFCSAPDVRSDGFDLGAPRLVPSLPPDMLGKPNQATTDAGITCTNQQGVCLAPLLGLEHRSRENTEPTTALVHHDFNARAGWRLTLYESLQWSTAANLPLVSADQSQGVMAGDYRTGPTTRIKGADQALPGKNGVTWGSDLQFKFSNTFNLNLFYDYSKSPASQPGQPDRDERFGTRLEYKFK